MGDNAAQISDWNGVVGERWAQLQIRPRPDGRALRRGRAAGGRLARGESAIDVGCGCGDTALQLARTAGPAGAVLGIDVSAPMLAVARQRSAAAALSHLQFQQADAASAALPGGTGPRLLALRRDVLRRAGRGVHEFAARAAAGRPPGVLLLAQSRGESVGDAAGPGGAQCALAARTARRHPRTGPLCRSRRGTIWRASFARPDSAASTSSPSTRRVFSVTRSSMR